MKQHGTVGIILCQCARGAPVDERVAVGQELRGALRFRAQGIRRVEALEQLRGPGRSIQLDDLATASRCSVYFIVSAVLRAMRGVVVQRDDFDVSAVRRGLEFRVEARVVLKAESDVGAKVEGRVFAVETPDYGAVCAVYFVDGARVARGEQVVTVGVFVNAVDVEVVPCVGGVVAGSSLSWADGKDCFYMGSVICDALLLDLCAPSGRT